MKKLSELTLTELGTLLLYYNTYGDFNGWKSKVVKEISVRIKSIDWGS